MKPPDCHLCGHPASPTRKLGKDDVAPAWHCGRCGVYVEAKPRAVTGYGAGWYAPTPSTSEDAS